MSDRWRFADYVGFMHNYVFPGSYAPWLARRLPKALRETKATCDQCLMAKPVAERPGPTRDPGQFLNHLKCCTYFPFIPNFSLGAFSAIDFEKANRAGLLLPVGLYPSIAYQEKKVKAAFSSFGKSEELLCPFFNSERNACGIWSLRPGVCTSYFCQSDQGVMGIKLWGEIESFLNQFEWILAKRVFEELGFSENELAFGRAAISLETEEDEREFFIEAAWGSHNSSRFEFYQKARELALRFTNDQIEEILGADLISKEKSLREKIEALEFQN